MLSKCDLFKDITWNFSEWYWENVLWDLIKDWGGDSRNIRESDPCIKAWVSVINSWLFCSLSQGVTDAKESGNEPTCKCPLLTCEERLKGIEAWLVGLLSYWISASPLHF